MPDSPASTPAERFASILLALCHAVAAMSGGDRLSYLLIARIIGRIRPIKQRVAKLLACIRDGTYVLRRRSAPTGPRGVRRPRHPGDLPHTAGWLLKLVPDAVGYRSQLEYLLRDPEMAELLAAAPASLGRPLRSLCWMLRLPPPDIVAAPARPRPPREKTPRRKREPLPSAHPRGHPDAPAWMCEPPHRTRWSFGRIRGYPRKA